METCDVLIAGGGPAGSTCAWRLGLAGFDVMVMDRAVFPRDKVCAGWITPQVVSELALDLHDYRRGRTLQRITGFRTGIVGEPAEVTTTYGQPVSYGIRRCEFDHYLLSRARARSRLGTPVRTIRRDGAAWVVNASIRAPLLIGAGGHFCPVARWLNPSARGEPSASLVVAREAEFPVGPDDTRAYATDPELPALFFSPELTGYGWCFRKQGYVNVGFGHLDSGALVRATDGFVEFLADRGIVPRHRAWPWRGHAYHVYPAPRRLVDAGVMLVGDAAGLAYPQSGEGIRPAVESGLLAAETINEADGNYDARSLDRYADQIRDRLEGGRMARSLGRVLPPGTGRLWARTLLQSPRFVRHVVLDRWFLHTRQPALVPG
jgi:flavin-dependent dehydrogenase